MLSVRERVYQWLRRTARPFHARSEAWLVRQILCLPQRHFGEIAADMDGVSGGVMLDLGGADGFSSAPLAGHFGRRVVLDLEEQSHPDVVADGVSGLPFPDGAFSYILSLEVLEHVADPRKFLSEAARVLAPGGRMCLSTRQYFRTHGAPHDYFRYTEHGLRVVFSGSGLRIDRMTALGGPFTVMATAWDQFCGQIGLGRPPFKQILCYPFLLLAIRLDGMAMRSGSFRREPDTTGWLVFAAAP